MTGAPPARQQRTPAPCTPKLLHGHTVCAWPEPATALEAAVDPQAARRAASGLAELGYPDYRRSDAAVIRLLQRGPVSIGRLGEALGVTRQAARKVADGLERRGLAVTARDEQDSRQVNILLTPGGEAYARAVVAVICRLNEDLRQRVDPDQLVAADALLRAVLHDDRSRQRAARLAPRPPHSTETTPPSPANRHEPGRRSI